MVDFLFIIIELFRYLLQLRRGNLSKLALFEAGWTGGSLWAQISDRRGHCPPTTVSVRKLEWLPFRVVSNICSALFGFVTKHACDRRMDGQTDRWTDRITTPKTVPGQLHCMVKTVSKSRSRFQIIGNFLIAWTVRLSWFENAHSCPLFSTSNFDP